MASKRQIQANRANRKRWQGHSREGLARLRDAALSNQPWRMSTGPRTPAGKERSRMNALKHGGRSAKAVQARRALTALVRLLSGLV